MKALAEQINELDGVEVYGRVVGVRGLMVEVAGPIDAMSVGARVMIETPANAIACEVVGFTGSNALLMPFAALDGVRRGCRAVVCVDGRGTAVGRLAGPGGRCDGPADRRQGAAAVRRRAVSISEFAAGRACAGADRQAARSWRARAQHVHHLLPRPAHGHLLRLRRRQIGAARHAGAQRGAPMSRWWG